jgi:hypothetical protein
MVQVKLVFRWIFRTAGKVWDADGNVTNRDTLYFNAFTEDLFFGIMIWKRILNVY